jgi:hypothetical protein
MDILINCLLGGMREHCGMPSYNALIGYDFWGRGQAAGHGSQAVVRDVIFPTFARERT